MPIHPKCRHCGSVETTRSHRRFLEKLIFVVRPYRCDFCNKRFLVLRTPTKPISGMDATVE